MTVGINITDIFVSLTCKIFFSDHDLGGEIIVFVINVMTQFPTIIISINDKRGTLQ